jgi:hypothetical protein
MLDRPLHDQQKPIGLERLLDEIVGALLDRGDGCFDVAVPRNHDHRQIDVLLLDGVEQLQPVERRALEPNIQKRETRPPRDNGGERLVAVAGRAC